MDMHITRNLDLFLRKVALLTQFRSLSFKKDKVKVCVHTCRKIRRNDFERYANI